MKISAPKTSEGRLLALLTACFYGFFTLVPDSHSLMVAYPWVLFWQIGLLCPIIWLLWLLWYEQRFPKLGNGIDWLVATGVIGIVISALFSEFPQQALWYGGAACAFVAALYALNSWLDPRRRYGLLVAQGYLSLAFIVLSLFLWTTQTLLPELARIESLKQYGVNVAFDFSTIELRNWAPIGHQNYVAGYLLLALPLLVGLSVIQKGWRRSLWLVGVALGLVDLYTTSSRGGWLGLITLSVVSFGILLWRSRLPRLWLGLGGAGIFTSLMLLVLANNRLRSIIGAVLSGKGGGELAYRMINLAVGWRMGSDHPLTGVGLGGVPLLYQKYRPVWAGRESELAYQLHSTPAQLWAEMGLWGIVTGLGAIALLTVLLIRWCRQDAHNSREQVLVWSIYAGLFAYGVISLTDYQLDNICISGTLTIYIACLASIFRPQSLSMPRASYIRTVALAGLGVLVAAITWLIPIDRAWHLSDRGFQALYQDNVEVFVENLSQAHQLAFWEPYYPHQLGWNLGNLALQTDSSQQQLLQQGISWLEQGNTLSPYREFGHSNLAWLLLYTNPQAATTEFAHSAELVPAKRGVFSGLGLSLLAQNQTGLAVEAFTIEALRNPLFITSPIWRSPQLSSVYPQVLESMVNQYTEWIKQDPNNPAWYLYRGGVYWWQGKIDAAIADLQADGTPLRQVLLQLAQGKDIEAQLSQLPPSSAKWAILAWLNPEQRPQLLQQAWVSTTQTPLPPQLQQELIQSMESASSFEQWLKSAPALTYRYERTGFGVLSRHLGGSTPQDFWTVVDNAPMSQWFSEILPSPIYSPKLDLALQPRRESLLELISGGR